MRQRDSAKRQRAIDKILASFPGTSRHDSEEFGISMDDLEEIMVDGGYERCPGCDVWVESGELVDAENNVVECESCFPRRDDD